MASVPTMRVVACVEDGALVGARPCGLPARLEWPRTSGHRCDATMVPGAGTTASILSRGRGRDAPSSVPNGDARRAERRR